MSKVAFIGLGVMGYPMAGHLQTAGHQVTVFNRTPAKAEAWAQEHQGDFKPTPAEAVADAEIVFSCVGNDDDLREIGIGKSGILSGVKEGAIWVDHTTTSANVAKEMAKHCEAKNIAFLDAPVSGGQQGAENGALTIMCGGDEAQFETIRPIIDCYARAAILLGPVGNGQLTKMVNQICIGGLVQGLSEAIHFADNAGLDIKSVIDVISKGAAQSWQMDNRHKTMIAGEYEHGFAVDWMRKDLNIVLEEARRNGSKLPVTALVDQFYADVQEMGGNRWDTSSLLARLKGK